jgi:Leucine-rich repeat (LRR) protein
MKLTSLEQLELSFCESLKWFPEILGQMKNTKIIVLKGTSIEEFPFSFRNLIGLHTLGIWGSGMLRLPGSIHMMPNLSEVYVQGCQLLPIQNDVFKCTKTSSHKM